MSEIHFVGRGVPLDEDRIMRTSDLLVICSRSGPYFMTGLEFSVYATIDRHRKDAAREGDHFGVHVLNNYLRKYAEHRFEWN